MASPGAIRIYGSGADIDGGTQTDPESDLGGFRSSREIVGLEWSPPRACSGVRILRADPLCLGDGESSRRGVGTLRYRAATTSLTWQEPGSSAEGLAVDVSAGGNYVLPGGDVPAASLYVDVSAQDLADSDAIDPIVVLARVHDGMGEVSESESISGLIDYRLHVLRNDGAGPVSQIVVGSWARKSGALTLSDDYAASGAVILRVSEDLDALGWPKVGLLLNQVSAEILCYYRRTSSSFYVASGGRGAMGTVAAAGTAGQKVFDQPAIKIGFESPGPGGNYQIIPSKTTAPAGVVFHNARQDGLADGPQEIAGGLAVGAHCGVWVARYIVAGAREDPWARACLCAVHTHGGDSCATSWLNAWQHRGTPCKRIYWNGGSGPVDVSWPIAEPTSSPYMTPVLPSGINDFYVRNFDGLYEEQNTRLLRVEVEGDYLTIKAGRPRTPDSLFGVAGPNGTATISAAYLAHGDPNEADQAALFWDAGTGTIDYNMPKIGWTAMAKLMGGRGAGRVSEYAVKAFPSFTVSGLEHGIAYRFSILVRVSSTGVESLSPGYVEVIGSVSAPSGIIGGQARGA